MLFFCFWQNLFSGFFLGKCLREFFFSDLKTIGNKKAKIMSLIRKHVEFEEFCFEGI